MLFNEFDPQVTDEVSFLKAFEEVGVIFSKE
jgi:hypothetical protein